MAKPRDSVRSLVADKAQQSLTWELICALESKRGSVLALMYCMELGTLSIQRVEDFQHEHSR